MHGLDSVVKLRSVIAIHSDAWLMSMAFHHAGRVAFDRDDRPSLDGKRSSEGVDIRGYLESLRAYRHARRGLAPLHLSPGSTCRKKEQECCTLCYHGSFVNACFRGAGPSSQWCYWNKIPKFLLIHERKDYWLKEWTIVLFYVSRIVRNMGSFG